MPVLAMLCGGGVRKDDGTACSGETEAMTVRYYTTVGMWCS